jgi:hypothetical protein
MPVQFDNGYFDRLSRSPGVVSITVAAAQKIAATARASAPSDTNTYRNGIKVVLKFQRRAVALVVGTDKKTMLIESKTGNLARALRAHAKGRR